MVKQFMAISRIAIWEIGNYQFQKFKLLIKNRGALKEEIVLGCNQVFVVILFFETVAN